MSDLAVGPEYVPDDPYDTGEPLCDVCESSAFLALTNREGWVCVECGTLYTPDGRRLEKTP